MRKLRCKVLIGLTQGKTVCQASPEARIPVSSLPDQYYICSPPRGLHLRMYSEILQIKLIWIYINLKQASKQTYTIEQHFCSTPWGSCQNADSDSADPGQGWDSAFLSSSRVILKLLLYRTLWVARLESSLRVEQSENRPRIHPCTFPKVGRKWQKVVTETSGTIS